MKKLVQLIMVTIPIVLASCSEPVESTNEFQEIVPSPVTSVEVAATPASTLSGLTPGTEQNEPTSTPIPCSGQLTSPNQEGPFYKVGSPERETLIDDGLAGTPILIMGRVFNQDCTPLSNVMVDFWLANVDGEYDNDGYTLRGHQFTDANGYYSIESIEPTPYTGRPSHIHIKLFGPNGEELLTTQMYFPGSESSADVLNAPDLLVTYLDPEPEGQQRVLFNFIVQD